MTIMSIISLFSILFLDIGRWILIGIWKVPLFFDGAVYSIVAYCYDLFLIMCNVNYNTLYGIAAGLVNRLEAVIMVFIVFKVGLALIEYMINPEKAAKEGSKILVNIFITAALLISYNFIFTVFNELNMLIVGNPTGYEYTVLGQLADVEGKKDEGLIMRFVFGANNDLDNKSVGNYMAYETLTSFIYDSNDVESETYLNQIVCNTGKCKYMSLPDMSERIVDGDVSYLPFIGLIVGLYLIYSIVMAAIQIGVRMFKMLILQMIAPIAIISIIGEGIKANTFQKFVKKYISTYIEAFVRILSMLIICSFSVAMFKKLDDFFMQLDSNDGVTKALLTALIVVAAFKFAQELPKFIDDILSTHLADNKESFGKFLKGIGKAALGTGLAAAGLAVGASTGSISAAMAGIKGGYEAGFKGKGIADTIKRQGDSISKARSIGVDTRMAGGNRAYWGAKMKEKFGIPQKQLAEGQWVQNQQSAMDNMVKNLEDYYDEDIYINGQKIGLNRGLFKQHAYNPNEKYYSQLSEATREAVDQTNAAESKYNAARSHANLVENNHQSEMQAADNKIDRIRDRYEKRVIAQEEAHEQLVTKGVKYVNKDTGKEEYRPATEAEIKASEQNRDSQIVAINEELNQVLQVEYKAKEEMRERHAAETKVEYEAVDAAQAAYQSQKENTDKKVDTDYNTYMLKGVKEGKVKIKGANAVKESIRTYNNVADTGFTTEDFIQGTNNTKTAGDHYTERQDQTTYSRAAVDYTNSNYSSGKKK